MFPQKEIRDYALDIVLCDELVPSCYAAAAGRELAYFGGPTWEQLEN